MPASTQQILDILAEHGIEPSGFDLREQEVTGEIGANEDVFEISVEDILGEKPEANPDDDEWSEDYDPVQACPPSAPMEQFSVIAERRVSGSS